MLHATLFLFKSATSYGTNFCRKYQQTLLKSKKLRFSVRRA
jgi:hypothetical protein